MSQMLYSRAIRACALGLVACAMSATSMAEDPQPESRECTLDVQSGPLAGTAYRYRLVTPSHIEEGRRYPLVLLLHGAGERDDDNRAQLVHYPGMLADAQFRREEPYFLLAPQCRAQMRWVDVPWDARRSPAAPAEPSTMMQMAIACLEKTVREEPIDTDRIYLTGLSMGGYGSWDLAWRRPGWFAAAVPICGGGDVRRADRLVGLPIWAFHGADDPVVPPRRSTEMVEAINRLGGDAKLSILPGVGHDSWTGAYGPDGAMAWMFSQRRSARPLGGLTVLTHESSGLRDDDRIVFLGDSITEQGDGPDGYVRLIRDAIAESGSKAQVLNAGISGNRVPDLLERLDRDVLALSPTVVFVYIGINDVWHSEWGQGTSREDYRAGLSEVVASIRRIPATVILATPTTIGERPDGSNPLDPMLEDFAAITRRVAEIGGADLCDLRRACLDDLRVLNADGSEHGVFTTDGVHLNAAGNRWVADRAARALARALRRRVSENQG